MKLNKLFLISLVCISQAKAMNFDTIKSKYNQLNSRHKKMLGAAIVSLASVYAIYKYVKLKKSNYNFLISRYAGITQKLNELNITKKDINEGTMGFTGPHIGIRLKNGLQEVVIIVKEGIASIYEYQWGLFEDYEIFIHEIRDGRGGYDGFPK